MNKKLAGVTFIYNGIEHDYNYRQAIVSLMECCDHVYVVECDSNDGTKEDILNLYDNTDNVTVLFEDWTTQSGREKLSYFTNIGIMRAERDGYDYVLVVQADEIISERSYSSVREAMKLGCEAYMVQRVNLWGDCYHKLVVPENRMPCSTAIIRLAKSNYRAYDDAESIDAPVSDSYFWNSIKIYHMGFVRRKEVMISKIRNMQVNVFQMSDYDNKLKGMEVFDSTKWFDGDDLALIDEPLPLIIQQWAKDRL